MKEDEVPFTVGIDVVVVMETSLAALMACLALNLARAWSSLDNVGSLDCWIAVWAC